MGAWIEIICSDVYTWKEGVAPYMGAWIEIVSKGLYGFTFGCRSLHGSVD